MRKFLTLVIAGAVLIGCTKEEIKTEVLKPYVISYEDSVAKKRMELNKIPEPPFCFYAGHQVILDKSGGFYYYQKYSPWKCDVTPEVIPEFLGLDPIRIVKIPSLGAKEFIIENLRLPNQKTGTLIIGSRTDTISDPYYLNLIYSLGGKDVPAYLIRRTTHEEDTLLLYKKSGKYYNPKEIKWDKSKIKFPEQEN